MFVVNDDLSIYATRGDIVCLNVSATDDSTGTDYEFQPGDIVRMKIFAKKDAENVVMQKDFPVVAKTFAVGVFLTEDDTKIGEVISKPTDYWYEIELNPYTNPQTIVGYDEDGAKIFKLFPEGKDITTDEPTKPEDIPVVDEDLSLTSSRPVENKAIARAVTLLQNDVDAVNQRLTAKISEVKSANRDTVKELEVERARIDNLVASPTPGDSELVDIRVGADGVTYDSAGTAVRSQAALATKRAKDIGNKRVSEEVVECALESGYLGGDGTLNGAGEVTKEVTTDYIPVKAYDFVTVHTPTMNPDSAQWRAISYYDSDKNFIRRGDYTEDKNYVLPSVDGYIRVSFRSYGYPYVFITKRNVLASDSQIIAGYHKSNYDYVSLNVAVGYMDSGGSFAPPTFYGREVCSDKIPVNPGEKYFFASEVHNSYGADSSGVCHWIAVNAFDSEENPVGRLSTATITTEATDQIYTAIAEFTIPSGTNYIVVSSRTYDDCLLNLAHVAESDNESENVYSVVSGVAHRGLSASAPENTLPAYKIAKKHGFKYVECDVSFTSDGVAVLLHDDTVDRTSSGSGSIGAMTLEEVKALDFGSWFSSAYSGTTIPTFAEFMALCRNIGLHPYIELKAGTKEQISGLVDVVRSYNMLDKVTWISFSSGYLGYIKEFDPKARLGYVCTTITEELIDIAKNLLGGENEVFIDSSSPTVEAVKLCSDAGLPLEVWTVNDESTVLTLDPYVSGITSDSLLAGKVLRDNAMGN